MFVKLRNVPYGSNSLRKHICISYNTLQYTPEIFHVPCNLWHWLAVYAVLNFEA